MNNPAGLCQLEDFGTLRFSGPDAVKFLQGQLSNDVAKLAGAQLLRAGLHNPQGRTLALLWLASSAPATVLAMAPLEVLPATEALLRRYLLRAKVTISDASAQYRLYGVCNTAAANDDEVAGQRYPYDPNDPQRALLLQLASDPPPRGALLPREQWRSLDIVAGLPQVYAANSGQFVAQMLNLDCVDAISFTKGCYTGQEVIARAHYRGRIKRRLQRFVSDAPVRLAAGDVGRLHDGRSFRVVDAGSLADGRCEFLAVTALPGAAHEAEDALEAKAAGHLVCQELALPYALPV